MESRLHLRPAIKSDSTFYTTLKNTLTGERAVSPDTIKSHIPRDYRDYEFSDAYRTEMLSIPFNLENEYIVKVFTPRTTLIHSFFMKWRNLWGRTHGVGATFSSNQTPTSLVKYRYNSLLDTFSDGGYVPKPEYYTTTRFGAILITTYTETTSLYPLKNPSEKFSQGFETLKLIHSNGYTHGDLSQHTFQEEHKSTIHITDIIGNTPDHRLDMAKAYDLASLMTMFSKSVGTWAVAGEIYDDYPPNVFKKIPTVTPVLKITNPTLDPWILNQIKKTTTTIIENNYDQDEELEESVR
jgi:hypothetical protein